MLKRILALAALACLVVVGLTASFRDHDPTVTSGWQLPEKFGTGFSIVPAKPTAKAYPFGNASPVLLDWLSPTPAKAGSRWVFDELNWRDTRGTVTLDSACAAGKIGADTTAAYPMSRLQFPMDLGATKSAATTVAADTIAWFGFYVGGCASAPAADSLYVGTQVSIDGISWVTVTNTLINIPAATIPPIASAQLLENASSNQFGRIYQQTRATVGGLTGSFVNQGATAPTDETLHGWNYIRWVVTWSIVGVGSNFRAFVGHWEE